MNFSLWAAITALLLIVAVQAINWLLLKKLRRQGLYPQRGKATMADVERLLNMGSRGFALRCYREIHRCSLRQASEAISALSAQQK